MKEVVTGTVEGTGAAINISLGFIPSYVKVFNYDDAGTAAPTIEWWSGMPAASGLKNTTDTQALVTTNGISEYAGSAAVPAGFTIGADADINASEETLFYVALR